MTFHAPRILPLLLGLAAMAAMVGTPAAFAADEAPSGGTFNAPGYPQAAPPARAGTGAATGGASVAPAVPSGTVRAPGAGTAPTSRVPPTDTAPQRADALPPAPTEFQKFVEAATGRLLPIFGSSFFAAAADSFAPVDNVPVSADYTVGPGDEIVLRAWGSIDVDYRSTVDRNGLLNLPKVGSFNVTGIKASELEKQLRAQIARLYTNFNLSVSLGQLRAVKVFVVGPAQRPGVYTLASQSTLLTALVAAGGPAPQGSMRKVLLKRDSRVVAELDVYDFLVQGDKSRDIQLAAGDVIVFQAAGARVALNGALDTPAIYELKTPQEPLREVLRYSGGLPLLANLHRAQLERVDPAQVRSARSVEDFKLDAQGLQQPLRDGDVLTLLAISPQIANAVTLKGHVAQPLRYPFTPGMRIRDLIPDRDALISPGFYRRKNLLVQVIEGDQERSPITGARLSTQRDRGERAEDLAVAERAKRAPATLFDDLNWDYAVVERLNEADLSTQVIPFNLGKAVLQSDAAQNIELRAGDVVTIYSQKDVRVPVARQTRLVSIEGEIGSPGVYQLQPGETLKGLIARAGGFTPQAYVYGLEFSREETRQRQRENLSVAVARLEALAGAQAARQAANRSDDAFAASGVAASNAATQAQLARLAQIQPNGRIALELPPGRATMDVLPDVPLEHADRITVPPRPGYVTVAGAVVNVNSFIWRPDRTAGDYLKLAGTDETADPSNMFILRADGTVSHAGDQRSFFGGNKLMTQKLEPGDALIVPNQLDFETWGRALVRNLKDWSQIFYQFGLGAAAIRTLSR
jgi:polysaccharide biosynthesis/export protein